MSGGASGFGFEVPQGDPGELDAAASSWRQLVGALDLQGQAVASGSEAALGAGSWEGAAAGAFAGGSERLVNAFTTNVAAAGQAASALSELGRALEQAQQVTGQALAECERCQSEAGTQQAAADQAGQDARRAEESAASAMHPSIVAALSREAAAAQQQQGAAQSAANLAQNDLSNARTRGIQAVSTYEHQAQAIASRLRAAGGELRSVPELGHGWAEPVVTWAGHVNDFAGAGAVGLIKGYDQVVTVAAGKLADESEAVLGDPQALANIANELPIASYDGALDPLFERAAGAQTLAETPLTKILTAGLPEDTFNVLGKVPYLAMGVTALDMFMNRKEGLGQAVVQPVGNLVAGSIIADPAASAVAAGVTSLTTEGGALAVLGTTAIVPGVGEVVLTGVVVVGGVMAIDYVGSELWDHRGAIVHGVETAATDTWHGVEHSATWVAQQGEGALHTGEHVVHDLEPWNWSL